MAREPLNLPPAIFIGFCVKQTKELVVRPDTAVAVWSVSECIAHRPDEWVHRWDFNRAFCYNTERQALDTIPNGSRDQFELFAYRIIPIQFSIGGKAREVKLGDVYLPGLIEVETEPALTGFEIAGYDIVNIEAGHLGFGCSPLSCNGCAAEHAVNSHCLIDELDRAAEIARIFADSEPEPGPYYLVEILRKCRD